MNTLSTGAGTRLTNGGPEDAYGNNVLCERFYNRVPDMGRMPGPTSSQVKREGSDAYGRVRFSSKLCFAHVKRRRRYGALGRIKVLLWIELH